MCMVCVVQHTVALTVVAAEVQGTVDEVLTTALTHPPHHPSFSPLDHPPRVPAVCHGRDDASSHSCSA